jgi:hypothetical protein
MNQYLINEPRAAAFSQTHGMANDGLSVEIEGHAP